MIRRLLSLPIKGEHTPILAVDVIDDDGCLYFIADCDVNCDGLGGNPDHDPYFQPDTAYHYQGQPINPYIVPAITVPKSIVNSVPGIVLGCKAQMIYRKTGLSTDCIVGDTGPTFKLGEATPEAAKRVGMNPNPNTGGEDDYNQVIFKLWPGRQVVIDGIQYPLQPA